MSSELERRIFLIGASLLGLAVGSFVNVLIFRLPRGRSIVTPPSHCFCCGTLLSVGDNIPILSFLLAGRRCRHCGVALSGQYLWVEAACGILFAAIYWRWGLTLTALTYALATIALVAGTGTDLRYKIIPDSLNYWLLAVGLTGAAAGHAMPSLAGGGLPSLGYSVAGVLLGWFGFEAIVRLGRWWLRQEAMGGGDVLLAAGIGALLGPGRAFGAFFLVSILSGAVVGVAMLATGRLNRREPLPFGPFLVCGALVVMLWPELGNLVAQLYGF